MEFWVIKNALECRVIKITPVKYHRDGCSLEQNACGINCPFAERKPNCRLMAYENAFNTKCGSKCQFCMPGFGLTPSGECVHYNRGSY